MIITSNHNTRSITRVIVSALQKQINLMSIEETNNEIPEVQEASTENQIETPEVAPEVVAEETSEAVAEAVVAEAAPVQEPVKPEVTVEIVAPAEFDWTSLGKKGSHYSKTDREKLENLYDKTLSSIVEHEVIDGSVVTMNNREVVVNIGFKSDGVIPLSELKVQSQSERLAI